MAHLGRDRVRTTGSGRVHDKAWGRTTGTGGRQWNFVATEISLSRQTWTMTKKKGPWDLRCHSLVSELRYTNT